MTALLITSVIPGLREASLIPLPLHKYKLGLKVVLEDNSAGCSDSFKYGALGPSGTLAFDDWGSN
eukprot:1204195-Pleurochrysis_carterae.AAC.1